MVPMVRIPPNARERNLGRQNGVGCRHVQWLIRRARHRQRQL
jgi:hypothetical protein